MEWPLFLTVCVIQLFHSSCVIYTVPSFTSPPWNRLSPGHSLLHSKSCCHPGQLPQSYVRWGAPPSTHHGASHFLKPNNLYLHFTPASHSHKHLPGSLITQDSSIQKCMSTAEAPAISSSWFPYNCSSFWGLQSLPLPLLLDHNPPDSFVSFSTLRDLLTSLQPESSESFYHSVLHFGSILLLTFLFLYTEC